MGQRRQKIDRYTREPPPISEPRFTSTRYWVLQAIMCEAMPPRGSEGEFHQWDAWNRVLDTMCASLKRDNKAFNEDKFREAVTNYGKLR